MKHSVVIVIITTIALFVAVKPGSAQQKPKMDEEVARALRESARARQATENQLEQAKQDADADYLRQQELLQQDQDTATQDLEKTSEEISQEADQAQAEALQDTERVREEILREEALAREDAGQYSDEQAETLRVDEERSREESEQQRLRIEDEVQQQTSAAEQLQQ